MDSTNLAEETQWIDSRQIELYQRIQDFSLDRPEARFPFSQRLATDNGWSPEYTARAIEEYKKFTFLAVTANHPVTPSDAVDRVWHLHLSYTRSYWEEFCPKVLQVPLHHNPTEGGEDEQKKFADWYRQTLESYERNFGRVPPTDIWSVPEIRFGERSPFQRVNPHDNWVLPKERVRQQASLGFTTAVLAIASGGWYIETYQSQTHPLALLLFVVLCAALASGCLAFFMGLRHALSHPKAPNVGACSGGGSVCGGCGGGCGGGGCGGG